MNLIGQDNLSGVAAVYYKLPSASQWTTFTGPFDVTEEAHNIIQFYTLDNAGNAQAIQTGDVRIDHTAPVTSCDATASSSVVHLAATDAVSGAIGTWYSTDGSFPTIAYTGPFATPVAGSVMYRYYSTDAAGNAEPIRTLVVDYDQTPPTTTSNIDNALRDTTPFSVTLSAIDNPSGFWCRQHSVLHRRRFGDDVHGGFRCGGVRIACGQLLVGRRGRQLRDADDADGQDRRCRAHDDEQCGPGGSGTRAPSS